MGSSSPISPPYLPYVSTVSPLSLPYVGGIKLTDFGIAVKAPDDTQLGTMLTAETGTYRWMAPEVICHERYSRSADVFSFGGVLYELICHEPPFSDRSHLQASPGLGPGFGLGVGVGVGSPEPQP